MTKHTPGAWLYQFEGGTTAFIVESDGTTVAALRVTENSTAHSRFAHNVRLMSAAPELLEALHHIMLCEFNSMSSRHEMARLARKAVARATGEPEAKPSAHGERKND